MAEAESSILIVDDDADDLSALEKALDSLGCKLHTVTDPHDVLPAVYREQPDVVVLDALLPGLSGFDLCKQIKTDAELKQTQVVIITGVYLRQLYRQEALQQFKADGFLTKPFRAPELQRLVVELLAKKTRKPPSSFLSRLGLPPTTPAPKKRGFFGRLFGKKEEPASVRIALPPPPRVRKSELPKSKSGEVASLESASESNSVKDAHTSETTRAKAAPAAAVTEASQKETETAPAVPAKVPAETKDTKDTKDKDAGETEAAEPKEPTVKEEPVTDAAVDVNDGSAEEKVSEPKVQKPAEKAAPEPEPKPEPEPEPEKADAKPSSSDELGPKDGKAEDRRGPDDAQPVGVEASTSRSTTAKPEVEEKTHAEPVVTASVQAPAEPSQEEKPKPDEAAASPAAAKRPKFLDGDVPIYDEEYFYSELKRELSKCRRVDRPLTLILIQVGDLAQIVELFGQETREAVLWHVAEQATAALREVDLVGMMLSKELIALAAFASDRYGGGRVVARIRKLLEQNPFRVGEELPPIVPALQFGLSSFPDDGDEVVALIAKASDDIEP